MGNEKADIKADIGAVADRGESISLMMPLLISEGSRQRGELTAGAAHSCSAAGKGSVGV